MYIEYGTFFKVIWYCVFASAAGLGLFLVLLTHFSHDSHSLDQEHHWILLAFLIRAMSAKDNFLFSQRR